MLALADLCSLEATKPASFKLQASRVKFLVEGLNTYQKSSTSYLDPKLLSPETLYNPKCRLNLKPLTMNPKPYT